METRSVIGPIQKHKKPPFCAFDPKNPPQKNKNPPFCSFNQMNFVRCMGLRNNKGMALLPSLYYEIKKFV